MRKLYEKGDDVKVKQGKVTKTSHQITPFKQGKKYNINMNYIKANTAHNG